MFSRIVFLLYIFPLFPALAQNYDEYEDNKFIEKFQFGVVWGELGPTYPIREKKLLNQPYGLAEYLYYTKRGFSFGALGIAVYYKDRIGIETAFVSYYTGYDNTQLTNYIINKYPNHYTNGYYSGSGFDSNGWTLRLCYRKHFKHFFIEPKIQMVLNRGYYGYNSFRLKEKGSNQFIQHTIEQSLETSRNSYHALFSAMKRFRVTEPKFHIEVGIKAEMSIAPNRITYSVIEQPYGQLATINRSTISAINAAYGFGLVLKMYFGKSKQAISEQASDTDLH